MTGSERQPISPRLTSQLASDLRELLQGIPVGAEFAVPPPASLCDSLELLVPAVLRRRHPEWEQESLDGIFVARATRTGPSAAEIVGTCILIRDQTVTPFRLDLEIDSEAVAAVQVMLGEPGSGPLGISGPPCNSPEAERLLTSLIDRVDGISWSYVVGPEQPP